MSKGNPRLTVRVSPALLEAIAAAVDKRNGACLTIRHWTLSDYVVQAIKDKLGHDLRSRRKRATHPKDLPLDTDFWRTPE